MMLHPTLRRGHRKAISSHPVTAIVAWLVVTPPSQAAQPSPQYPPRRLSDGGLLQRGGEGDQRIPQALHWIIPRNNDPRLTLCTDQGGPDLAQLKGPIATRPTDVSCDD
jgi:hypothetical protein